MAHGLSRNEWSLSAKQSDYLHLPPSPLSPNIMRLKTFMLILGKLFSQPKAVVFKVWSADKSSLTWGCVRNESS